MRRTSLIWGLVLSGSCAAANPGAAQEIIQAGHGIFSGRGHQDEPQRFVVTLPPPRVEVHDKCSSNDQPRRCLFGHRDKQHGEGHHRQAAPLNDVLYAPATLPAMVLQAPAPVAAPLTFTQQITHDFSALRQMQELEIRAAGLEAQRNAQRAMLAAEDDALAGIAERHMTRMKGALKTSAPGALTSEGVDKLNDALQKLNDRISQLEVLVLQHQQILSNQRNAPAEKKPGN
ncbi:MAG: hypothetical protein L0Y70_29450 [Gemmataceae bacterium]|nr:hypothetical protein [Gemmataceae bacterium]